MTYNDEYEEAADERRLKNRRALKWTRMSLGLQKHSARGTSCNPKHPSWRCTAKRRVGRGRSPFERPMADVLQHSLKRSRAFGGHVCVRFIEERTGIRESPSIPS